MFVRLVSTTLLGLTSYQNIYKDIICIEDKNTETALFDHVTVPTLAGVAQKIARTKETQMDIKQYTAYEVIYYTFLLEMIKNINNPDSPARCNIKHKKR